MEFKDTYTKEDLVFIKDNIDKLDLSIDNEGVLINGEISYLIKKLNDKIVVKKINTII